MIQTVPEQSIAVRSEEFIDEPGLASLEAEWRQLAVNCATATVFQTFEWNAAWWRNLGRRAGRKLRIWTLRDGSGALVALAPLMTSHWYGTPLTRLSFLGTGTSDYLDLLAAPGYENEARHRFHDWLAHTRGWHVADF